MSLHFYTSKNNEQVIFLYNLILNFTQKNTKNDTQVCNDQLNHHHHRYLNLDFFSDVCLCVKGV